MGMRIVSENFSPRQAAAAITGGLALIVYLGIAAAIALALAALWLVAELALLTLQTIVECANSIAATYQSADPLVKFLILVVIGYACYRTARAALRRVNR